MSAKVTKWLLLKNAQESKFRKLKWCITKKGHQLDLLTEIRNRLCMFFSQLIEKKEIRAQLCR